MNPEQRCITFSAQLLWVMEFKPKDRTIWDEGGWFNPSKKKGRRKNA